MNAQPFSQRALVQMLAEQLRKLLGGILWLPTVKLECNSREARLQIDIVARFQIRGGPEIEFLVECKNEPRPSQFPIVVNRFPYVAIEREFEKEKGTTKLVRVPVFAAPYISPRMAEICESHHWSWFDLAGNCRISVPGLLHLEHRGNPPVHHRLRPVANLSSPEAGRVIRALLQPANAMTRWTQREVERHFGELALPIPEPSLGLINKVVRHLRDEAFIEDAPNGGFRLIDPMKLLFAWRDAYRFDRHERRGYFALLQGRDLRDALARLSSQAGGHAVYATFSAAEIQAPHVRQPKTWMYIREKDVPRLERLVEAKPVESGENMVVLIPDDEGIFYISDGGVMGDPRMPCTNAVQTFVDLWHSGGGGKEAAEALLEQRLKPEWKFRGMKV